MFEHKVKPFDLHKSIHTPGSTMHINTSKHILRHLCFSREIGRPEAMNSRFLQMQSVAAGSAMHTASLRCVADRLSWLARDDLISRRVPHSSHTRKARSRSHSQPIFSH